MANLIITIIGIALVAVAAIMGAYYGGVAFENAQINATANAIVNEAQQILVAERLWSANNAQPDIGGMSSNWGDVGSHAYFNPPPIMNLLISGGDLSEWPSLAGSIAQPSPTSGAYDQGCYKIGNYQGPISRFPFAYKGSNYVSYGFSINVPYDGTCTDTVGQFSSSTIDTSEANHPIVLIAKAINDNLKQIPSNADMSTIPYVGLPQLPANSGSPDGFDVYDTNGNMQTYCFLDSISPTKNQTIYCIFGPS